jgi:hypoxanthine phosphoribosyltransferase
MPLGVIFKRYEPESDHPFFVFAEDADIRSEDRVRLFDLAWPSIASGSSILVVDDVITFGNTFEAAESLIRFRVGNSPEIRFFTFAADKRRLAAAKPNVFRRLQSGVDIDNRNTWLVFPWERL